MISCIPCQKLNPFLAIGGESELHLVSDQWSMPTENMNLVVKPCPFDGVCLSPKKVFKKYICPLLALFPYSGWLEVNMRG